MRSEGTGSARKPLASRQSDEMSGLDGSPRQQIGSKPEEFRAPINAGTKRRNLTAECNNVHAAKFLTI